MEIYNAYLIVGGTVKNVIVIDEETAKNRIEKYKAKGIDCEIIPYGNIPADIGDTYLDGSFYRDGILVEPIEEAEDPEAEELVSLAELTEAYTEGVEGLE